MNIPTQISKCDECEFHYLYADLDGIHSGCRRPKGVIVDCFGALERREKTNGCGCEGPAARISGPGFAEVGGAGAEKEAPASPLPCRCWAGER